MLDPDVLVCRPFQPNEPMEHFLSEAWFVTFPFGVPLSTPAWHALEQGALRYLAAHPPHLVEAYYPEPFVDRQGRRIIPLPCHKDEWGRHVNALIGPDEVCYITDWLLLPRDLDRALPAEYRGEILYGPDPDFSVYLEWTDELWSGPGAPGQRLGFDAIWNFGLRGFVLPRRHRDRFRRWVTLTDPSEADIREFFETIKLGFRMWHEIDGILVLSHVFDAAAVCRLLNGSGAG